MNRRTKKITNMPARPEDGVAALLRSVRQGGITGDEFCAEVAKLEMAARTRLLAGLLRDYKDLNNFTPATGSEEKVAS
jgi:hypothetical protein